MQDLAAVIRCPRCGEANPPRARFCLACGDALPVRSGGRESRRTVTVVFTDVTGSTSLGERLDAESMNRVMARYFQRTREVLERHGGTVEKFIGDAVVAVFGVPVLHEDDALRAVLAAADLRANLDALNAELSRWWGVTLLTRTGVNTGEVIARDSPADGGLVLGDAVNVAARLEQAAQPGEILIGEPTWQLTRDAVTVEPLEPLALKGKADAVRAFRLQEVRRGVPGRSRPSGGMFVGREGERRQLEWAFERVVHEQACHLVSVLGPAGVGKSRLVAEFLAGLQTSVTVLTGRCLPYGDGITFWPLIEMLHQALGVADDDTTAAVLAKLAERVQNLERSSLILERVAQVLGAGDQGGTLEEAAWAIRKLLESMGRRQPLIVVIDDLQWAEPTFLDLVDHVLDFSRHVPILVLTVARPELLDDRQWGAGRLNASAILLEPLERHESALLLGRLLDGAVAEPARELLTTASEGNPLFLEELVAMLREDGTLHLDGDRWTLAGGGSGFAIPPTISALLAARLDRLAPGERAVLEGASVVGQVFDQGAAVELSPPPEQDRVRGHLLALVRKELVRPSSSGVVTDEAFQFRHLLVRDATYAGMPKQVRADLHERFVAWLERVAGERIKEYEEIVAFHLEQAYRYRAELGPLDPTGVAVGVRAAERLAAAGARAEARSDLIAAEKLLSAAVDVSRAVGRPHLDLLPQLGGVLVELDRLEQAAGVIAEARAGADASADPALPAHVRLAELRLLELTDLDGWAEVAATEAAQVAATFEALGDHRGMATAWRLVADVQFVKGQAAASEEAGEQALVHARKAGDAGEEAEAAGDLCGAALYGPRPVADAVALCEQIAARFADHPAVEARALRDLAGLVAMTGDFDRARELIGRSLAILDDLGRVRGRAMSSDVVGTIELLAGDPGAAERVFRPGCLTLQQLGERGYLSSLAALEAEALWQLGRDDEAERWTTVSEEAAARHDPDAQARWRSVRAKVAAADAGRAAEAAELARAAVRLADGTDCLDLQGDALRDLAIVLDLLGDPGAATAARAEARARYLRKGNVVSARRMQDLRGAGAAAED